MERGFSFEASASHSEERGESKSDDKPVSVKLSCPSSCPDTDTGGIDGKPGTPSFADSGEFRAGEKMVRNGGGELHVTGSR